MGNWGISEILVIALVAICVLKPSQLYRLSLVLGKLWGKTLQQYKQLKSELNQNLNPPE